MATFLTIVAQSLDPDSPTDILQERIAEVESRLIETYKEKYRVSGFPHRLSEMLPELGPETPEPEPKKGRAKVVGLKEFKKKRGKDKGPPS